MMNAMNLGMPELIFIFLLALVVVGPKRLPGLMRELGKYMAEFKRASNEFKNQLEAEMLNIELEEQSKKQAEPPKLLPPEEPWEPPKPAPGIVSRGNADAFSDPVAEPPVTDGSAQASELPPPAKITTGTDA